MAERSAVFIDAGYLEAVLKQEFNGQALDFGKLAEAILPDAPLLRAYYYNCPPYVGRPPDPADQERQRKADRFYRAIERIPYFQVRRGKLAKRNCRNCNYERFEQKRVDILLSVDLVRLSSKQSITHAALIAGDSDFIPAIEVAKNEGVQIHLWHGGPDNRPHGDLIDACDAPHRITQAIIDAARR